MTDINSVLSDIDALGSPFRVVHPALVDTVPGNTAASTQLFHSSKLCDQGSGEARRMVHLHARSRGMETGRHAGSLVFQRYCHRVCGVAVAAWLLYGVALDLRAAEVSVLFTDGSPDRLVLHSPRALADATPEQVLTATVDVHLHPLARAVSAETGPGMGNLFGNIAAGFAGGFRGLANRPGTGLSTVHVHERADLLLSARPELHRGGDFRLLPGVAGPHLFYDRRSCCHWYAAPDGRYCSWCSRLSRDERTQRFKEATGRG
ncbi:hypothetical protein K3888_06005 [Dietzia aurantiaca]|uniref:IucA/IucC family C-terminal-domain containing protein n=1 Tax=Dietzia aurantiaca TaxID=983873 RepID=UPI001E290001|nr:IucA/IucC family C-terminal-domain containing protein [Dietzia aurantiaca]MCD2262253.1 hypothetical protein [Dietzia aurantiaca]